MPEHFTPVLRPASWPLYYLPIRLGVDRRSARRIAMPPMQDLAGWVVSLLRSRVRVRARGYRSDRAVCCLLHDPFDGVGTLTALRAAAEAVVNLAHPQPLSDLRKSGTKLLITEHVARADDHDLVLTHISGHGRNERKQNKSTAPPRHESYELRRQHVSAPCSPCFGCRDIMHVPSPSNLPSRQNALG
jgi:hypothetical protein